MCSEKYKFEFPDFTYFSFCSRILSKNICLSLQLPLRTSIKTCNLCTKILFIGLTSKHLKSQSPKSFNNWKKKKNTTKLAIKKKKHTKKLAQSLPERFPIMFTSTYLHFVSLFHSQYKNIGPRDMAELLKETIYQVWSGRWWCKKKQGGGRRAACPHIGIIRVPKDRRPSCLMEPCSVLAWSRALPLFGATVFAFFYPLR